MNEPALIQDAQHGDLDAFNTLVLHYQDMVFNVALRVLGDDELAADAAQEALMMSLLPTPRRKPLSLPFAVLIPFAAVPSKPG